MLSKMEPTTIKVPRFKILNPDYIHKLMEPIPDAPKATRPDLKIHENIIRRILYSPITYYAFKIATFLSHYLPIPVYFYDGFQIVTGLIYNYQTKAKMANVPIPTTTTTSGKSFNDILNTIEQAAQNPMTDTVIMGLLKILGKGITQVQLDAIEKVVVDLIELDKAFS